MRFRRHRQVLIDRNSCAGGLGYGVYEESEAREERGFQRGKE